MDNERGIQIREISKADHVTVKQDADGDYPEPAEASDAISQFNQAREIGSQTRTRVRDFTPM